MNFELLQPWSTFVMKSALPSSILEKMIRITDEIVDSELQWEADTGSVMEDQFLIDFEILEQEEVMNYFLDACRTFVVEAFCQSHPLNKENALKCSIKFYFKGLNTPMEPLVSKASKISS